MTGLMEVIQKQSMSIDEFKSFMLQVSMDNDKLKNETHRLDEKQSEHDRLTHQATQCFHKTTDIKVIY